MDGVATPEEYCKRAKNIGMQAIAITDHGALSGHRPMYRAAKAEGIKPILGIEGYITHDRFDKRDKKERLGNPLDLIYNHIVILAKNQQGLENLNRLNELAWTEGYYSKPRIDFELLEKYKDGLIVLSACMSGLIAKALEFNEYAEAKRLLKWFKDTFKDDFYVEVMPHNSKELNNELLALADSMDIKSVVTPDCHHASTDQKVIQEIMLLLNTHAKLTKDAKFEKSQKIDDVMKRLDYLYGEDRFMSFRSFDIHLLSYEEMKQAMIFRFINPERNDFPDIDSDIADSRRDEVKSYLESQYKNVASIATFLMFKGKGIVRDVSRAFNIPLSEVNKVLKTVDDWDDFITSKNAQWFRLKYPDVVRYGEQLRGRIRGTGIHAAGVVTAKEPIFKYAPLETRSAPGSKERIPVVAVDMEEAADIGLIKLDVLGLKTLTVIDDTLKIIKKRHKINIKLKEIPLDDPKVYEMLSDGRTKGVFQCEATPYTNLLVKMGVSNLDELAASNALVRPGAMNTIGKSYLARKHGREITEHIHPIMQKFTKDTYGCVLYQEQVMQACVGLGGMSMAEADKVRKIIGKKKDAKEFDEFKDKFVTGASKHITPFKAEGLWHDFEAHAGYSFNKSHAVAYSMLSYWTAWLKYYYGIEFMYSLLKNEQDKDARTEYLIEAKRMGIALKLPHINESDSDFKIEGNGIRIGLSAIKWISDNISSKIMARRPFNSYQEFYDFVFTKGSGVNSRSLAALDAVGALTFTDNPRDEKKIRESLYEYLNLPEFKTTVPQHYYAYIDEIEDFEETGVYILMGVIKNIKRGKGWSRVEIMDSTGLLGVFDDEETKIEAGKTYIIAVANNRIMEAVTIDDIKDSLSNPLIKFLNYKTLPYSGEEYYVVSFKSRTTKAGKKMANMIVADTSRDMKSIVIFPTKYSEGFMKCEPGKAKKMTFETSKDGTEILREVMAN